MKKDREMLEKKLSRFMRVDNLLELGCFNGSELGGYTSMLSKYAKHVVAIDIDNKAVESAKAVYNSKQIENIEVIQMNAAELKFNDNSFDCVTSSSFHEMYPSIQMDILKEADRVLKYPKRIIFMEPHEKSVTCQLFKVFDPKEDHSQRIKNTKQVIINFAKQYGYKIKKLTNSLAINQFDSKEDLLNGMLGWWADIHVPNSENEKNIMLGEIENKLKKLSPNYYKNNQVNEFIWSWVLEKERPLVDIVKATIYDVRDYAKILNQSWKDTYGKYISKNQIDKEFNIKKLIESFGIDLKSDDYEIFMLKQNNKNIGIMKLGKYEDKYKTDMKGVGEILSLHIGNKYLNKGIGSQALKFAYNYLKGKGYSAICLWTKKQNYNAIQFYKKHGYKITEYANDNPIDGAPSFVMEKAIE